MVDIVNRLCIHSWELKARNGDHFKVEQGKTYTTDKDEHEGHVTVFSNYWVPVPSRCFVLEERPRRDEG